MISLILTVLGVALGCWIGIWVIAGVFYLFIELLKGLK